MSDAPRMSHPHADQERYEIRLRGQLDDCWQTWFEGFRLTADSDGTTTLAGPIVDQAALHGLLRRIGDLGLTLISINATPQQKTTPDTCRPTNHGVLCCGVRYPRQADPRE